MRTTRVHKVRYGRPRPIAERILIQVLLMVAATCTAADGDEWWPQPLLDPLRSASLPLELSRSFAPEPGKLEASFSIGYFNELSSSWHIGILQRELGREGEALQPDLLHLAEARHSQEPIFHIDLEGTRSELWLAYGLGRGFGVTVTAPWMSIGRPTWDSISSTFHSWFGIPQNNRLVLQHGQSCAYLFDSSRQVEELDLAGSGLGDTTLSLSGPAGRWLGGSHRWALAVEMPTGDSDTLLGSGGWDVGLQWTGSWVTTRSRLDIAGSYVWLDETGSWLGVKRSDTAHLVSRYTRLFPRLGALSFEVRVDDSPLADISDCRLSDRSFFLQLGWRHKLGKRHWLAFVLGEDYPVDTGTQPDLTFVVQIGAR